MKVRYPPFPANAFVKGFIILCRLIPLSKLGDMGTSSNVGSPPIKKWVSAIFRDLFLIQWKNCEPVSESDSMDRVL